MVYKSEKSQALIERLKSKKHQATQKKTSRKPVASSAPAKAQATTSTGKGAGYSTQLEYDAHIIKGFLAKGEYPYSYQMVLDDIRDFMAQGGYTKEQMRMTAQRAVGTDDIRKMSDRQLIIFHQAILSVMFSQGNNTYNYTNTNNDTPKNPSAPASEVKGNTNKTDTNTDKPYIYIQDDESLTEAIALRLDAKVLGIDVETLGLDPHLHKIRLVQIATDDGKPTIVVDCFKCDIRLIQPLLSTNAVKISHNAKFEIKMLTKAGLDVKPQIFCTQLAYQLLNAGKDNIKASLESVAKELIGVQLDKTEQKSNWGKEHLTENQIRYAALDAEVLIPLREKLKPMLVEANLVNIARIEFDCVKAIAQIELNGMLLNQGAWLEVLDQTEKEKDELALGLKKALGTQNLFGEYDLNLDSPAQLKTALNTKLGLNLPKTDKEALKPYSVDYPVINDLLSYKKKQKLLSSFGKKSLLRKINPVTGRVHPEINQIGAKTGRMGCQNPNLQQVPSESTMRSMFCAAPGNKYVICDFSQIELRITADITQETKMIDAYNSGLDLHLLTASLLFNKPLDQVTKHDRQIGKSVNFATLYGSGANGIRSFAKGYGIDLSLEEAESIKVKFFESYKKLNSWIKKHSRVKGNETRTMAGRRQLFPKGVGVTNVLNSPVQGTSADITKLALARLPIALEGTGAMIIMVVHDEIIVEVSEARADEVAQILSAVMVEAGKEFLKIVPVEAEASIGESWADK